jgi:hypothetical protein
MRGQSFGDTQGVCLVCFVDMRCIDEH